MPLVNLFPFSDNASRLRVIEMSIPTSTLSVRSTPLFKGFPWYTRIVFTPSKSEFVADQLQKTVLVDDLGSFIQVSHTVLHCVSLLKIFIDTGTSN